MTKVMKNTPGRNASFQLIPMLWSVQAKLTRLGAPKKTIEKLRIIARLNTTEGYFLVTTAVNCLIKGSAPKLITKLKIALSDNIAA